MDFYDLVNAGINVSEGISYTGRDDKYISAIQRFYSSYEKNRKDIEGFIEAGDIENYTILVHAVKSNARTLGADKLFELALDLEMKGREKDVDYVIQNNPKMFEEYEKVIDIFKPYGEMEKVKPADEIDETEAFEVVSNLLSALEDFDDERSLELMDKLSGYPFRPTQKNLLSDAKKYVEDFFYDEATAIIVGLTKYIQKQ